MKIKESTILDVWLDNIKSEKESGISFIEGKNKIEYLSYKKLFLEASYKLHALQQKGLSPGDELVFQFQSNKSFIITFWACFLGGFIPVPVVLGTTTDIINKINGVWSKLKNPFIITDAPFLKAIIENYNLENDGVLEEVLSKFIYYEELTYIQKATPVEVNPSDLVFIQFSSGSTGLPKGVMNSQKSILYNINNKIKVLNIQDTDRFLGWMPLSHDMGLILFHILPLLVNADQFLMSPMLFLSCPELWIESLSEQRITISGSPNFGYVHVLENLKKVELEKHAFDTLRIMVNSAEPVSINVCREFVNALKPYGMKQNCINPGYGLAEAVLGVSIYYEEEKEVNEYFLNRIKLGIGEKVEFLESNSNNATSFADLGKYDGTEIKITNENNETLLEDSLGIIHLRSPAITSGYYNDPEATKNILSKEGWLNTGDIGFIHNERLVITGRKKEMIIINGQNYFPNDLDRLIEELPTIKFQQAISCTIFNEKKYQDELFIFVHYKGTVKDFIVLADSINELISEQVGITVKKVVAVEKIPRTTSGKIQRYVLRDNYINGDYDEFYEELEITTNEVKLESYVAPTTDVENKLAEIWSNYFKFPVSTQDNFHKLGGDSLGVFFVLSNIQKEFGVTIEIQDVFRDMSFNHFVELIKNSSEKSINQIEVAPIKEYYSLSGMQKRLFIHHQINPLSIAYNTPVILNIQGDLDIKRCEEAFREIIDRHEILRTSFHILNKEFIQKIHTKIDFNIQQIEGNKEDFYELLKLHITPFCLENPSLIRVLFFKEHNKIVLDVHHIVADGASFDILFEEFNTLYNGGELSPLPFQYKDFSLWNQNLEMKKALENQKEFWQNQFKQIPEPLNLPLDFPRLNKTNPFNGTVTRIIDENKRQRLNKICSEEQVTMFTLLLSIFYSLLYKLTGQEDIVIGTSTIGRWHTGLEKLIGMFTNLLPLRSFPKGAISFLEFLEEVKYNVLECLANQEYSYERLAEDLKLKPNISNTPLFNIMFEYHAFNWSKAEFNNAQFSGSEYPIGSKFDLTVRIIEEENRYAFLFDYNTSLFKRDSIERLASYFTLIIDQILRDKKLLLKDINLLSNTERNKILTEFNNASTL